MIRVVENTLDPQPAEPQTAPPSSSSRATPTARARNRPVSAVKRHARPACPYKNAIESRYAKANAQGA